jgi:hypothetical protein
VVLGFELKVSMLVRQVVCYVSYSPSPLVFFLMTRIAQSTERVVAGITD